MLSLIKRITMHIHSLAYPLLESNREILGGKLCLKGTRISVDLILEWIASGASIDDIINQYSHLKREAVEQAIQYAINLVQQETVISVKLAS
ncbi:MAG: DUF433 domain-containing protein [Bacteroidia bacterium]